MRWVVGAFLLVASCGDFGGNQPVLRHAANDAPCTVGGLAVISRPPIGVDGTYVVEGCGQRLTYELEQGHRWQLVSRAALPPP